MSRNHKMPTICKEESSIHMEKMPPCLPGRHRRDIHWHCIHKCPRSAVVCPTNHTCHHQTATNQPHNNSREVEGAAVIGMRLQVESLEAGRVKVREKILVLCLFRQERMQQIKTAG